MEDQKSLTNKKYMLYAALIILTIVSILPWFKEGVAATDDFRHHIAKFWWMKFSLVNYGEITEWMPYIYSGWPLTHFYHSLPYFASVPLIMLFKPIAALKASVVVSFILAAIAMFIATKNIFKNSEVAAIASILYTLAPVHFEFAYMSGSISRLWGFIFIPLAISYFITLLKDGGKKNVIIFGLSFAALMYTHINMAIAASYFLFFYAIYHFFISEKKIKISKVKEFCLCAILILGILAFWLIPYMTEKQDSTAAEANKQIFGDPGALKLAQVFRRSFGRDVDGNGSRSFYIGYVFLLASLAGMRLTKFSDKRIFGALGILGVVLSVFTKPLSILPFARTTYSSFILLVGIFFLSLLAAAFIQKIISSKKGVLLALVILALFVIDVYPAQTHRYWTDQGTELYTNSPVVLDAYAFVKNQPGFFRTYSLVGELPFMYTGKSEIGTEWTGYREGAFRPIRELTDNIYKTVLSNVSNTNIYSALGYMGVKFLIYPCIPDFDKILPLAHSNGQVCVYENPLYSQLLTSPGKVEISTNPQSRNAEVYVLEQCNANCEQTRKKVSISDVDFAPERIAFLTNSTDPGFVLVKVSYFKPHWHAFIDGKETQIRLAWPYYMLVDVPAGTHSVEFRYTSNINHVIGGTISIITILILAWILFSTRIRRLISDK